MTQPTLEELQHDANIDRIVREINGLRKMSKDAEVDRQAIDDIRDSAYGRDGWTSAEKIAVGLEVPTPTVFGVLTTDKDVEAILDEIIKELPLEYRPITYDNDKDDYRYVIAKSLLDPLIKADDPMFVGKPGLHGAIQDRGRQIRIFPHQPTRKLQMQEAMQYIISSRHGGFRSKFERWLETHPDAMDRLAYAMADIMPEADVQARMGRVTGAPKLFRQFEKMDDSDDPDVSRIFFDIVTPPSERKAAKYQLKAKRLLLDENGNLKTSDAIVAALINERDIRNTKGDMVEPGDWEAFQAWRNKLIEKITNLRATLIRDGADTGLVAVHLAQQVETAIEHDMPLYMEAHKLEAKQREARTEEAKARTEAAASVQGIDANDAAVKEVLGRFNILPDQITDEAFRDLKSRLADYSMKAGSSEGGAGLLENYLDGFGRANQLLEDKAAQVEAKAIQDLQKEVSTPTGAATAVTNLLFQHPEWGLRREDLTKERQDWLAQFVSQIGVDGLSTYIDDNPGEVQNWLTENKSQVVVSEGRAGLKNLLTQMGYGGVVDGISQADVILDQWDIPKVLQDIANRPGEDPSDILMEHLGLEEPARYPYDAIATAGEVVLDEQGTLQPIGREPTGFRSLTEPQFDEDPVEPFEPLGIRGTGTVDTWVAPPTPRDIEIARLQEAQLNPFGPPSPPIAPEDRTEAQKEAYALFPDMPSMGGVEALPVSMYPTPPVALPRGFEESRKWGVARDTVLGPEMEAMIARRAGGDVSLIPYLRQEAIDFLPEFRSGVQDARAEWTANLMESAREAEVAAWETEMVAWNPEGTDSKFSRILPKGSLPVIGGWDKEEHGDKTLDEVIKGMSTTGTPSVEFMPAFEERIATLPRVMELRKAKRLRRKGRSRFV